MSRARSVANSTLVSATGALASYGLTILLARDSGAEPFGAYILCLTWAAILIVLIDCASSTAFSHLAIKEGDSQSAFNTVITIRVLAVVGAAGVSVFLKIFGCLEIPWQTILFLIPAFNLGNLFEFHGANVRFAAIICIEKIVLFLANFLLLSFFEFNIVIYFTYAAITLISLIWQCWIYRGYLFALKLVPLFRISSYVVSYWPLVLINVAQIGYGHLSRLVIETKHGIVIFASVSIAFQFIALASLIQTQVDRHFRPPIIKAIKDRDDGAIYDLILNYLIVSTLPMFLGAVTLFLLAPWMIEGLFGPDYEIASDALRYLSPLFVSVSLMRLADHLLLALDRTRLNLSISLTAATLMLGLMISSSTSQSLSSLLTVIVWVQYAQAIVAGGVAVRIMWKEAR